MTISHVAVVADANNAHDLHECVHLDLFVSHVYSTYHIMNIVSIYCTYHTTDKGK